MTKNENDKCPLCGQNINKALATNFCYKCYGQLNPNAVRAGCPKCDSPLTWYMSRLVCSNCSYRVKGSPSD